MNNASQTYINFSSQSNQNFCKIDTFKSERHIPRFFLDSLLMRYRGVFDDLTGVCIDSDTPDPPPPICVELMECCDKFNAIPAVYDSCLVDAHVECCVDNADTSTCCDGIIEDECDVDYSCEQDYCCDSDTKLCMKCDCDVDDGWSSFGECSATCGVGSMTRTYSGSACGTHGSTEVNQCDTGRTCPPGRTTLILIENFVQF